MDTLKGKKIMAWTFMGNARMYNALWDYGDRISQIGLFSFKVRATGDMYETGVSISSMLTYINRHPRIKWLLTVANDGADSIFRALRDNASGAQDMFLSELAHRPEGGCRGLSKTVEEMVAKWTKIDVTQSPELGKPLLPLNCHKASFRALTVCRLVSSRTVTCTHVALRYWGVFLRSGSKGVLTCTHH